MSKLRGVHKGEPFLMHAEGGWIRRRAADDGVVIDGRLITVRRLGRALAELGLEIVTTYPDEGN